MLFTLHLWLGLYRHPSEWPWLYIFLVFVQGYFFLDNAGKSLGLDALLARRPWGPFVVTGVDRPQFVASEDACLRCATSPPPCRLDEPSSCTQAWRGWFAVTSAQPGETVSTVGVSPRMNQKVLSWAQPARRGRASGAACDSDRREGLGHRASQDVGCRALFWLSLPSDTRFIQGAQLYKNLALWVSNAAFG